MEAGLEKVDKVGGGNVRGRFERMQGVAKGLGSRKEKGVISNWARQAGRRGEALVAH